MASRYRSAAPRRLRRRKETRGLPPRLSPRSAASPARSASTVRSSFRLHWPHIISLSFLMTTWDDKLLANPHTVADKRSRVQRMFAAIAPSYDINNRLHSLWMDQQWRKKAVKLAELRPSDRVVDVA